MNRECKTVFLFITSDALNCMQIPRFLFKINAPTFFSYKSTCFFNTTKYVPLFPFDISYSFPAFLSLSLDLSRIFALSHWYKILRRIIKDFKFLSP